MALEVLEPAAGPGSEHRQAPWRDAHRSHVGGRGGSAPPPPPRPWAPLRPAWHTAAAGHRLPPQTSHNDQDDWLVHRDTHTHPFGVTSCKWHEGSRLTVSSCPGLSSQPGDSVSPSSARLASPVRNSCSPCRYLQPGSQSPLPPGFESCVHPWAPERGLHPGSFLGLSLAMGRSLGQCAAGACSHARGRSPTLMGSWPLLAAACPAPPFFSHLALQLGWGTA